MRSLLQELFPVSPKVFIPCLPTFIRHGTTWIIIDFANCQEICETFHHPSLLLYMPCISHYPLLLYTLAEARQIMLQPRGRKEIRHLILIRFQAF